MKNMNPSSDYFSEKITIPDGRNYWLVRTMGGDFYRDYFKGKFIAIGYDKITLKDIKHANSQGLGAQRNLTETIKNRYADSKKEINPSYAAAQILKFATEIKEGDIVIVPGKSHKRQVAIGVVKSKVYDTPLNDANNQKDVCHFLKRIDVSWIKEDYRNLLNPQMQLMFSSRHIVSNVSDYAEYIDSTTNDFYEKDNNTYLVLRVKTAQEISGSDFLFAGDIFQLVDEYFEENGLDINTEEVVKIKACVQSPGDIILFAKDNPGLVMFIIGALILLINGGGLKIDSIGVDLSTPGLLKSVSEFLDRRRDRKLQQKVEMKLKNLEIDNPEDILSAIKEIKHPRAEY